MLYGTRLRRPRIPPFRRRDLPGLYLAVLVFGMVAPLLPPLDVSGAAAVPIPIPIPIVAPAPPPPPPVQVQVVAASPVVPRNEILNKLAGSRTVALTFDDGPDPRWTPQVLAVLQRHGAVATFCMVEHNAAGHETLVRQVVAAGNRLCDHSRTHDEQLPDRTPETITDEVVTAGDDLSAVAGGAPVEWYRAPGGNWSTEITELSAEHGMQPLGWNVDPKDWERPGRGRDRRRGAAAAAAAGPRRRDHPAARRRRPAGRDGGGAGAADPLARRAGLLVRLPGPLIADQQLPPGLVEVHRADPSTPRPPYTQRKRRRVQWTHRTPLSLHPAYRTLRR